MTTPTPDRPASTNTFPNPSMGAQDGQAAAERSPDDAEHTEGSAQQPNTQDRTSSGSRILSMTGPAGEPGLPPSRPSSIATAQSGNQRRWSQAPPSRRGGAMQSGVGTASVAGSMGGQSRPTTSASRTHVPLAAHGFFRPMSSQRLQQQRNQRPTSLLGQGSLYTEGASDYGSNPYRQSSGSNKTVRGVPPLGLHHDLDPPPSRGTDVTDRDLPDRTTANTTPTGAETVRSRGESITPLQRPKPTHLDLSKAHKGDSGKLPTPSKSPRSFKSSFILPSREGRSSQMRPQQGHEKLASAESSPRLARKEITKEIVKKELGKNHEYFSGNTAFCWGGRLQNTRDRPVNIATGLVVVVPAALFFAFSAPWLWLHVSPAIPILFAYLFLICISSFFHASASDPGILPRNLHPFPPPNPNEDPLTVGPPTTEWTMVVSASSPNSAMEVPTKYCKSCNIWRPPRAHHCRVCDNCIETQDHHCVWLNNCIGRRNYRYFFVFVCTSTLAGFFLLGASLAHILLWRAQNNASFGAAINKWRIPFSMCIYPLIFTPYSLSLAVYHLFLMARGETTREYLNSHKFLKKDRHRPFTQGSILKNWLVVLQRPRPPTYLHFKKMYEEGDQRFGPRRGRRTAPLTAEQQGGGVEMQDVATAPGLQSHRTRSGTDRRAEDETSGN
ncbi:hypothetical protein CC78DRAFT_532496 [Lojkania enalia]|uniref:Palmitoyltransferase n=1 Tax=Lojkania enalia TaxID=147567 RepID=A0A9P4KAX2_9PLEO|nr:hypothetical protein CC78DRAFT_532496 [Didymosphaeria enalia]